VVMELVFSLVAQLVLLLMYIIIIIVEESVCLLRGSHSFSRIV